MNWKHLFAKKDLEMLLAEMSGEHRLHRVLGPVSLTALGVGCIIGAGIFVVTGRAAALDAGPAVIVSFAIAAVGCALAAFCYAEFASMAPVAGSVYTYAYTTLGEIFAWIIGWDLILEYAMGCAAVASSWSGYLNAFLKSISNEHWKIPDAFLFAPSAHVEGVTGHPWGNLPAVAVILAITVVLVLGIRESTRTNALLVLIKLVVVLFVVIIGCAYIQPANWTDVPVWNRTLPEEQQLPLLVKKELGDQTPAADMDRIARELAASYRIQWADRESERLRGKGYLSAEQAAVMRTEVAAKARKSLPQTEADRKIVERLLPDVHKTKNAMAAKSWGLLGFLGLNRWLGPIDDATRSRFMPYGLSGLMLALDRVFRFHRIRFDFDPRRGGEKAQPQRANRNLGLPVALHGALYGGGGGHYGHDAVSRYRHQGGNRQRVSRQSHRHAQPAVATGDAADCRRRIGRHDQRHFGVVFEPSEGLHGNVARRPAARRFRPGPSSIPHAAHRHHGDRHRDRRGGRHGANGKIGGNGKRRHAHGVHHGLCVGADPSPAAAERRATVPLSRDRIGGAVGNPGQSDLNAVLAPRHVAAAGDLAGGGHGGLFRLQPPPQPSHPAFAARDSIPRNETADAT